MKIILQHFDRSKFPPRTADEIGYEKTPQYLTMKTVPRRIKDIYRKANQSVKFILAICDPTLRAYSDHKHMLARMDIPHYEEKDKKIYVSSKYCIVKVLVHVRFK